MRLHVEIGDDEADQQCKVDDRADRGEQDLEHDRLRQADPSQPPRMAAADCRTVLPQTLQRPERPAEPLLGERAERLGCLGPGDGILVVADVPARALDRDGEVLVLRQRVVRIAADLADRRQPPRADCTRHHGDRVEPRERPPLQVLRGDIFERLPFGDEVYAVADLRISRDRAQLRIVEPTGKACDRRRLELRIGVQRDDDLALRHREPGVESARLAAILQRQQADAWVVAERFGYDRGGAVLRPVIDHDHLDAHIGRGEHAAHRALDHALLVIGRDHHSNEAVGIDRREHLAPLAPRLDKRQRRQCERAQDADGDGDREQPVQTDDNEAQCGEQAEVNARRQLVTRTDRRHRGVARQTGERRDGDEVIARCAQPLDDDGQRRNRLSAIAPAIVQQDDVAAAIRLGIIVAGRGRAGDAGDRRIDDLLYAGSLPVARIDVQADRHIAAVLRLQHRPQFVRGRRLCVAEIGRAEQPQRPAGERLEQSLVGIQLEQHLPRRRRRQIGVSIGVAADLMPFQDHALQKRSLRQRILADDEEGPGRMFPLQHVEDLGRPLGVGTVVEGQREQLLMVAGAIHLQRGRQAIEAHVGDRAVRPGDRDTLSGYRRADHLQDLARPFDVDVGTRRDRVDDLGGRQRAVIAAEQLPQARVLGAQAPQREATDPGAVQHRHLVIGGRRVEQPDDVALVAFLISKAAVAAGGIEGRRGAGFARGLPGFLDAHRVAARAVPVVGVGADRDDELLRRDPARSIGDLFDEPVLRRDRSGIARRFVLVIRHQEDFVGHLGIGGQVPVGIADRRRDCDNPALGLEAALRIGQEGAVIGLCAGGQILEVEEGAARPVGGKPRHQCIQEGGTRARIGHQRGRTLGIPIAVQRVLDHRQHRRAVDRLVQDRAAGGVAEDGDVMIRTGHRHPAGDHPIELFDMATQARGARRIPGRVEGDGELRVPRCGRLAPGGAEQLVLVIGDAAPRPA